MEAVIKVPATSYRIISMCIGNLGITLRSLALVIILFKVKNNYTLFCLLCWYAKLQTFSQCWIQYWETAFVLDAATWATIGYEEARTVEDGNQGPISKHPAM